jgi:predicted nucleic acid-binding protein
MRVYAESNFVLEIVLEQEQHQACEELVSLASAGSIELVLPAFALLEPYQTIVRRKDDGKRFRDSLVDHAKQLERTAWIAADVPRLRAAAV